MPFGFACLAYRLPGKAIQEQGELAHLPNIMFGKKYSAKQKFLAL
jgi:hypothetical protein